jgi:hypothetical protein
MSENADRQADGQEPISQTGWKQISTLLGNKKDGETGTSHVDRQETDEQTDRRQISRQSETR